MAQHRFNKETAAEAGKKSGRSNKTKQWEQLGDFMTKEGAEKAKRIINDLDDMDFLDQYYKLLSYFKPKQMHNINEEKEPLKITFNNMSDKYMFDEKGNVIEK